MVVRKISQKGGFHLCTRKSRPFTLSLFWDFQRRRRRRKLSHHDGPFVFPFGTKAVSSTRDVPSFFVVVVYVVSRREREREGGPATWRRVLPSARRLDARIHHRRFFCHRMNRRNLDFDRHHVVALFGKARFVSSKRETKPGIKKKTSNATTKDDHEDTHGWDLDARRVREQRL